MSIATLTPAGADWGGEFINAAFHAITTDTQPDPEPTFHRQPSRTVSEWEAINYGDGSLGYTRRRTRQRGA